MEEHLAKEYVRMKTPGGWELVIILAVVLLLFGGAKIPQLAKNLGRAQKEFKDGLADGADSESDTAV